MKKLTLTASFFMDMQYAFNSLWPADMDNEKSNLLVNEKQHNIELGFKNSCRNPFFPIKENCFCWPLSKSNLRFQVANL